MEECYGSLTPDALAAHDLIYPTDLLADFLAGQRGAPARRDYAGPPVADQAVTDRGDTVVALRPSRRQA
ncbi:hypothetical protein I547_7611 [Mycobacterium kansasii 824]|nr:hypothetical protein I547_7611 [Mycobacterium kansasii 824]